MKRSVGSPLPDRFAPGLACYFQSVSTFGILRLIQDKSYGRAQATNFLAAFRNTCVLRSSRMTRPFALESSRHRMHRRLSILLLITIASRAFLPSACALDGGVLRLRMNLDNGWKAFEVLTTGDNPTGDGFNWSMPGTFDGLGALLADPSTLRVQVNHEISDATISEVDLDLSSLQTAISNTISGSGTGDVSFVTSGVRPTIVGVATVEIAGPIRPIRPQRTSTVFVPGSRISPTRSVPGVASSTTSTLPARRASAVLSTIDSLPWTSTTGTSINSVA